MKVSELIAQLQRLPIDYDIEAWLPGTNIELNRAFALADKPIVLIEGKLKSSTAVDPPSNVIPWVNTPARYQRSEPNDFSPD